MRMRTLFWLISIFLVTAAAAAPAEKEAAGERPAAPTARTESGPDRDVGPGEAIVWYLGHCGYAVRTRNHLLIFDYQEKMDGGASKKRPARPSLASGFVVPEEIRSLPVRLFVTHSHADHFDPVIFEWKETIPEISYYFGWQAAEDPSHNYLIGPRAEIESGGLKIYTVNSHHSGVAEVAYLVLVDGLAIYHNGDYMADYEEDYPFLKTKSGGIDIAFVPFLTDERSHYFRQTADLIGRFRPKAVLPMHDAAETGHYAEFEEVFRSRFPGLGVSRPLKVGDRFFYGDGAMRRE